MRNGSFTSAWEDYSASLELSRQIGDSYQEALAQEGLGSVLLQTQGVMAAKERLQKAFDIFESLGVPEADAVRDQLRKIGSPDS